LVFGVTAEPAAVDLEGLVAMTPPSLLQTKGVSKLPLVSRAKAALYAKNYAKAVDLYNEAFAKQPELERLYSFNLNLARSKIGLPPVGADFFK
jgi:hypothetical protein